MDSRLRGNDVAGVIAGDAILGLSSTYHSPNISLGLTH